MNLAECFATLGFAEAVDDGANLMLGTPGAWNVYLEVFESFATQESDLARLRCDVRFLWSKEEHGAKALRGVPISDMARLLYA